MAQRTVLVEFISYRGTDGEDHVGYRGEKVQVAAEGLEHFDFVHSQTPEYAAFGEDKEATAAVVKEARAHPVPHAEAQKS